MTTRRITLVLLSGLILLASVPALAQTTGNIRGQIRDADGGALPGVTITVTNVNRGITRTTVTGESGNYSFPALMVDTYNIYCTARGVPTADRRRCARRHQRQRSTSSSRWRSIPSKSASRSRPHRCSKRASSSVGTNFSAEFIEELPTNRNFWDMMAVLPGSASSPSRARACRPSGRASLPTPGASTASISRNADTGEVYWYINPDTIEEIQVLAIGAPAQYGNMSGAAFNVVTKSGTNDFKGAPASTTRATTSPTTNAEIDGIPFNRDKFHDFSLSPRRADQAGQGLVLRRLPGLRSGVPEPGVDPGFPADRSTNNRYDFKLNAQLSNSTLLDAKYHYEDWDDRRRRCL